MKKDKKIYQYQKEIITNIEKIYNDKSFTVTKKKNNRKVIKIRNNNTNSILNESEIINTYSSNTSSKEKINNCKNKLNALNNSLKNKSFDDDSTNKINYNLTFHSSVNENQHSINEN